MEKRILVPLPSNNSAIGFICAPFLACDIRGCGDPTVAPINCGAEHCDRLRTVGILMGMILFSIVIIIVNILVIRVVLSTPSLRRRQGYIKVSMATSDLLVGLFVIPSAVFNLALLVFVPVGDRRWHSFNSHKEFVDDYLLQKNKPQSMIFGTINVVAIVSSIYNLLLFSFDRFMAIARPIRQKTGRNFKKKSLYIWICIAWVVGIIISVIPAFFSDNFSYSSNPTTFVYVQVLTSASSGSPGTWAATYVAVILAVPYLATVLLNLLTMAVTWKRLKISTQLVGTSGNAQGLTKSASTRKKTIRGKFPEEGSIVQRDKKTPKLKHKRGNKARNNLSDSEACGWLTWWQSDDDINQNNNNSDETAEQSPRFQRTRDQITVIRTHRIAKKMESIDRFRVNYSYHIRVFKTILSMVFAFTVCIVPYVAVAVMMSTGKLNCDNAAQPFTFALYMLFSNSVINVFIYNYWNEEFRKKLWSLFFKRKQPLIRNKPMKSRSTSRTRSSTLSTLISGIRPSSKSRSST